MARPIVESAVEGLGQRVAALVRSGTTPALKVILVGNHPPSVIYTQNKQKFCRRVGAECEIIRLDAMASKQELLATVERCNRDPQTHGYFVQLPLPPHLSPVPVEQLVAAHKDVDGFHAENVGKIYRGEDEGTVMAPCTPKGIISLLRHYGIPLEGREVTIIGRSCVVGRPLALMMTGHHATVTLCHSRSPDIRKFTTSSHIIVSAVGRASFLDSSFIGPNRPVVVDVGINVVEGKLCGDAKYGEIMELCSGITPVPGGIGPMTILSLVENLVLAAEAQAAGDGGVR